MNTFHSKESGIQPGWGRGPLVAWIIGLVVGVVALPILFGRYPPGTTGDSIVYLDGATNLHRGDGYVFKDGCDQPAAVTHWPPGYSLLLAGIMQGVGEREHATAVACAILLGCLVALAVQSGVWMGVPLRWMACGGLVLPFHPAILDVYSMAWSETLFLPLVLGFLLTLSQGLVSSRFSTGRLLAMGLLAGGLAGVRWVGLMALPYALVLVGLVSSRRRYAWGVLCVSAGLIIIPLLVRNYLLAETLTHRSVDLVIPTFRNMVLAGKAFFDFILPPAGRILGGRAGDGTPAFWFLGGAGMLMLVCFALAAFGISWRGVRLFLARDRTDSAALRGRQDVVVLVFGSFSLAYLLAVIGSLLLVDSGVPLNNRLLLPGLITLAIAGLASVRYRRDRCEAWHRLLAVGYACWIIASGMAYIFMFSKTGRGYSGAQWRDPDILAVLDSKEFAPCLFSNYSGAFVYRGQHAGTLRSGLDAWAREALPGDQASIVLFLNSGEQRDEVIAREGDMAVDALQWCHIVSQQVRQTERVVVWIELAQKKGPATP